MMMLRRIFQTSSWPIKTTILLLALVSPLVAPRAGAAPVDAPSPAKVERPVCDVQCIADQAYYDGPDADPIKHKLDLFLPKSQENFPVLFFVHGGAWVAGDKSFFGRYSEVGKCLARNGVGVVLPNYRLSPAVKHPEHIKDVARAFAWTVRNVPQHGGDPNRIFLGGHSAGGHLATLLATDLTYLQREGIDPAIVKGIVGVSGVYRYPDVGLEIKDGKPGEKSVSLNGLRFLPNLMFTLNVGTMGSTSALLPVQVQLNPLKLVFGNDPEVHRQAFPLAHVRRGLPPFLLINASRELPGLPEMTEEFATALRGKACAVRTLKIAGRSHFSVMFRAKAADDPVARALLDFLLANP
jgi:acetyl esterase/lipase